MFSQTKIAGWGVPARSESLPDHLGEGGARACGPMGLVLGFKKVTQVQTCFPKFRGGTEPSLGDKQPFKVFLQISRLPVNRKNLFSLFWGKLKIAPAVIEVQRSKTIFDVGDG